MGSSAGSEGEEPKVKPDQPEGQVTGPTEEPTKPNGNPPEERKPQAKATWWKITKFILRWGIRFALAVVDIPNPWDDVES